MKKWKVFLILVFAAIALFIFSSAIAAFSVEWNIFFSAPLYLITFLLLANNLNSISANWILIILMLPILVLSLPLQILDFPETILAIPSSILAVVGLVTGRLALNYQRSGALIALISIIFLSFFVKKVPYEYLLNQVNFGLFTNEVTQPLPSFQLLNDEKALITEFNNKKIVILDFWNTKCAPCLKLFPLIDRINKSKKESISIFAVNIPVEEETTDQTTAFFQRRNLSFPGLYSLDYKTAEDFKIITFPTTLVIQNSKIVYRGKFEEAYQFAAKL